MMGLGKPKMCNKFEVASFSHCVNIEGEPRSKIFPTPKSALYTSKGLNFSSKSPTPNSRLLFQHHSIQQTRKPPIKPRFTSPKNKDNKHYSASQRRLSDALEPRLEISKVFLMHIKYRSHCSCAESDDCADHKKS